jgi:hypothetical protein
MSNTITYYLKMLRKILYFKKNLKNYYSDFGKVCHTQFKIKPLNLILTILIPILNFKNDKHYYYHYKCKILCLKL